MAALLVVQNYLTTGFLAVLLMGQVPELKWIGLDWIGLQHLGLILDDGPPALTRRLAVVF